MARLSFNEFSAGQPILRIQQPQKTTTTSGNTLGRVLSDIPSDIGETFGNVVGAARNASQNFAEAFTTPNITPAQRFAGAVVAPFSGVADMAGEAVVGATKLLTTDEFEKVLSNNLSTVVQKAAQAKIPLVGRDATEIWGNLTPQTKYTLSNILAPIANVVTTVGTGGVASAGVKVTDNVFKAGLNKAKAGVSDVSSGIAKTITPNKPQASITGPVPIDIKKQIEQDFTRAIKPSFGTQTTLNKQTNYNNSVSSAVESIVSNRNNLQFIDEATGETISRLPQSLKEFSDALDQTKASIYAQYNDIATKAGDLGAEIDMARIANSLDEVINSKSLKVSNPQSIDYAVDVRDRLRRTGKLSPEDVQDVIKNYNNSLDAFYRNPTPEGLTRNAVDALIANQLRRSLDEQIEGLTGAQYQALKNEYAALKTIERDVMRAQLRDARKNVKGLIDFTDVFSGGQVVSGILSFNPAVIAQGVAQKAISGAIKAINDPNRAVKKIFEKAGQYERSPDGIRTPSRKQLPAPEEGAPRSQVSSGETVRVAPQGESAPTGQILESAKEGAIKQPQGERTLTVAEDLALAEKEATQDALTAIQVSIDQAEMLTTKTTDGGYVRSSSFPNWLPDDKELRSKEMMEKVFKHLEDGTIPNAEKAGNQYRLWEAMKSHFEMIKFDKLNRSNGSNVSPNDIPFSLMFTTGAGLAAYYSMSEDGSLLPLAGVALMAKPVRTATLKSLDEFIEMQRKIANSPDYAVAARKRAEKAANSAIEERNKLKLQQEKTK